MNESIHHADAVRPRWYRLTVDVPVYGGEVIIEDWVLWCGNLEKRLKQILPIKCLGGVTWAEHSDGEA